MEKQEVVSNLLLAIEPFVQYEGHKFHLLGKKKRKKKLNF